MKKNKFSATKRGGSAEAQKSAGGKQTEIGEIPEDWRIVTIPDVASNFDNKRKPLSSAERSKIRGQYPYYGAAGIIDYVNDFKYEGNYLLIAEDGTVTSDGNRPMLQLARGKFWVSNHVHVLQCKSYKDTLFLYYQLKNTSVAPFITGAVQPKLSQENLNKIKFPWIENDDERGVITKILSDLDEKIELNHQMNKILESIAQAIFKRWFVEETENSTAEKLGDILETIESGSRPKGGIDPNLTEGIPSIGAENINGIGFYNYSKAKFISPKFFNNMSRGIIRDYDVLIYKDGAYIGRKSMFGRGFPYEQSCVNEHVFILRANGRANQFFLYFLLNQEELKQLNANSAQPGLNQESMKSFNVFIPNKTKIDQFGELVKPLIDQIFFNCCQIRSLSQTRDSLLPKLMSGRMKVST